MGEQPEALVGVPSPDAVSWGDDSVTAHHQIDDAGLATVMRAVLTGDPEADHARLDALLVGALRGLGYSEALSVYESTERWYA